MALVSGLDGIRSWRPWRIVNAEATDDTVRSSWKPSEYPTAPAGNKVISVAGIAEILIMVVGKDAENEAFTDMQINGWMDPQAGKGGVGIGIELWKGIVTLGARTISTENPTAHPVWSTVTTAGSWFLADTFESGATEVDFAGVTILSSVAQQLLLLPTLGFTNLECLIDLGTAAVGASLWRPYRLVPV